MHISQPWIRLKKLSLKCGMNIPIQNMARNINDLEEEEQNEIKEAVPIIISIAEPEKIK